MTERVYTGDEIEVRWNSEQCIHTGICLRSAPTVFDLKSRPWITVDGAPAEEVIRAVGACPTGALKVRRLGETEDAEELPEVPEIRLLSNGPAIVRGRIVVQKGSERVEAGRVALCRCGGSENKPFCDNTHKHIGFNTSGESPAAASRVRPPAEDRQSPADCG